MVDHPSYSTRKVGNNNFLDLPGPENINTSTTTEVDM